MVWGVEKCVPCTCVDIESTCTPPISHTNVVERRISKHVSRVANAFLNGKTYYT